MGGSGLTALALLYYVLDQRGKRSHAVRLITSQFQHGVTALENKKDFISFTTITFIE